MSATAGKHSPEIFRLWAAISTLSGAMERRLWYTTSSGAIYPNLFVSLVGPPGSGKSQALAETSRLMRGTKILHVAPKSLSSASLIDALEATYRAYFVRETNEIMEYHSMQLCVGEFGVFMPEYNGAVLSVLSDLYDGSDDPFQEMKRTGKINKNICDPIVSMIFGTQPDFLSANMPEIAWGQGFMARTILIYSPESIDFDVEGFFSGRVDNRDVFSRDFKDYLKYICEICGVFRFTEGAKDAIRKWKEDEFAPVPDHPRLEHYVRRRIFQCIKLCMISSISAGPSLMISEKDFLRARRWLLEAEAAMPDMLRTLGGKNDSAILNSMHNYIANLQKKTGADRVKDEVVYQFLASQVPSERVPKLLELAKQVKLISVPGPGQIKAN